MSAQGFPDLSEFNVDEKVVLEKFDGDAVPENLVERVTIDNGVIVLQEFIENGEVVQTVDLTERSD